MIANAYRHWKAPLSSVIAFGAGLISPFVWIIFNGGFIFSTSGSWGLSFTLVSLLAFFGGVYLRKFASVGRLAFTVIGVLPYLIGVAVPVLWFAHYMSHNNVL